MSKDEQMELALAIKKKELEEKKRKEEQKKQSDKISSRMAAQAPSMMGMTPGKSPKRLKKSSFFAYNPAAVKAGITEFKKKWGLVRLEDNWRRSNKTDSNYEDEESDTYEDNLTLSENEVNTILRDVPKTPDQLEQANRKIIEAMVDLGGLYRDKLNNYEKSVEILEKLFSRYSDFDGECKAMYYLQFSYKDLNEFSKGEQIINNMTRKYPDCVYTKILTDPDFVNSKKNKINIKEIYYQDIFKLYKKGDYENAYAKIENAGADIKKDEKYKIKMDFLKAKLLGKLQGKNAYILALEDFVKQYPNTPESISAKETLRFLKGDKDAFSKLIYEEDLQKFTYEPEKMHYILIVVQNISDKEMKMIKTTISNYNKKYHKLNRLKMSNIYFDTKGKDQIILIRKFNTAESAMKYYNQIEKNPDEYINRKYIYEVFAISQKNYREVIKQKSVKNYKEFFQRFYIEKDKK
jgi:tetratricopeptide (TPR) repeat protein